MFIGSVQVGFGGVDAAQVKSLADLFNSECRLFPKAGRDGVWRDRSCAGRRVV
jgi:hypothetical protein